MEAFASSIMLRLLQASLADAALSWPVAANGVSALLPLEEKQQVLAHVASAYGVKPLLAAGESWPRLGADPSVQALLAASTVEALLARWTRLERFTHSRHRVVPRQSSVDNLCLEHIALSGSMPRDDENALVVGVLSALLRAVGAVGLEVRLGAGRASVPILADGRVCVAAFNGPTSLWNFSWRGWTRPATRLVDSNLALEDSVRAIVDEDLGRAWRLGPVAERLNLSERTLQRRLRPLGGFSRLLGQARAATAGQMLRHPSYPICLIGFACGYSDQPHFTREFKRRTALTPAAFRLAFSGTASPA